jgi:hypothetical protein
MMHLSFYPYKIGDDFQSYEFISIGPNGNITKRVHFTWFAPNIYNLGFVDIDFTTGEIDDMAITNNQDSKKVLATIAKITHDFILTHNRISIIAIGNSSSRNRLYRIGITVNWNAIATQFDVLGLSNGIWERFEKQKNYDGFLIRRKKLNLTHGKDKKN